MPPKILQPIAWIALALGTLGSLRADIHLRGVMQREDGYHVVLWDSNWRTAPAWVAVGGTFHGFTVEAYDAARETVRLKKEATIWEVRLSGAPAIIAPRRNPASAVITRDGRRLCALHDTALVEEKGFVAGPQVGCELPGGAIVIAYMDHRAEFSNSFGWSIGKEPSPDSNVAIVREFCARCEQAYTDRLAEIRARKALK